MAPSPACARSIVLARYSCLPRFAFAVAFAAAVPPAKYRVSRFSAGLAERFRRKQLDHRQLEIL